MMLDPLAEIGIGMLMAILVHRSQYVVDFQDRAQGRNANDRHQQGEGNRGSNVPKPACSHKGRKYRGSSV